MKPTKSIALAIGVGYLLGRKHKLRTALMLGGAVATGRLSKGPVGRMMVGGGDGDGDGDGDGGGPSADGHGMLSKLGGAGKSAAVAALSKPAERLGTRLAESAEAMRQGGQKGQPNGGGQDDRGGD